MIQQLSLSLQLKVSSYLDLCVGSSVITFLCHLVTISFKLVSSQESVDTAFSFTCISTGRQVNSVVWIRGDFLLDNTDPPLLTNASTFSYTNVIMVSGRTPGRYTCQVRGPNDQVVSSADITVQGTNLTYPFNYCK